MEAVKEQIDLLAQKLTFTTEHGFKASVIYSSVTVPMPIAPVSNTKCFSARFERFPGCVLCGIVDQGLHPSGAQRFDFWPMWAARCGFADDLALHGNFCAKGEVRSAYIKIAREVACDAVYNASADAHPLSAQRSNEFAIVAGDCRGRNSPKRRTQPT